EATHCLLQATKECGWEADCVDVHLHFWMNLSTHEWQHDAKGAACQALIIYQATYQRRWYNTLRTTSPFNLKYLNEEVLINIKFKITSKLHTTITNQAREVSTCFVLLLQYTHLTSQTLCTSHHHP
ncbi:hypothetical protein PAXRUDRAFT_152667, partial [Paxillus rubicundulus Ve08.2h10]